MIVVRASVPIDPDRRGEAFDAVERLAERTRTEDGVLDYRAGIPLDDPNVVTFFEQYEDQAALDAHQESDHYREWLEALPEFLDGGVDDLDVTQFVVEKAFDPNENVDG